jgi:hypothetical protein
MDQSYKRDGRRQGMNTELWWGNRLQNGDLETKKDIERHH